VNNSSVQKRPDEIRSVSFDGCFPIRAKRFDRFPLRKLSSILHERVKDKRNDRAKEYVEGMTDSLGNSRTH